MLPDGNTVIVRESWVLETDRFCHLVIPRPEFLCFRFSS
jgi:hypothetical protein